MFGIEGLDINLITFIASAIAGYVVLFVSVQLGRVRLDFVERFAKVEARLAALERTDD